MIRALFAFGYLIAVSAAIVGSHPALASAADGECRSPIVSFEPDASSTCFHIDLPENSKTKTVKVMTKNDIYQQLLEGYFIEPPQPVAEAD